jgi:hypothetical protein
MRAPGGPIELAHDSPLLNQITRGGSPSQSKELARCGHALHQKRSTTNGEKVSEQSRKWVFGVGVTAILVVLLLVFGGRFFSLFPDLLHHPFDSPFFFLTVGLVVFVGAELLPWPARKGMTILRKLIEKLAEALLVVAGVVALFELPHFGEFYERAVEKVMTTTEWIGKLPNDQQRVLLESVVKARLGPGADSTLVRAFAGDVGKALDANQYVIEERRYLEKGWTDTSHVAMTSVNQINRRVQVLGASVDHLMIEYVSGGMEYDLQVDEQPCYSLQSIAGSSGLPNAQPLNPKVCEPHWTKEPRGYRVAVIIHLKRGQHDIERTIRRTAESPFVGSSFGLDYLTQALILTYHYPPDALLEAYGHGDLEGKLQGEALTLERSGVRIYSQRFSDAWLGRGTDVIFLLSPQTAPGR